MIATVRAACAALLMALVIASCADAPAPRAVDQAPAITPRLVATQVLPALDPMAEPAAFGSEPAAPVMPAAPPTAEPPGELVQVTATPLVPTMAPVEVTPTAPLTQAEEEEHARRALEAMRQSTEHMQGEMPPLP